MATADTVVLIAPEFLGDANLDDFITLAVSMMEPSAWGELYGQAVAYLTAHLMTMASRGSSGGSGVSGPVTMRKAGDVAESYGSINVQVDSADAWLMLSQYGITFLGLRSMLSITGPRLAGPVCV